MSNQTTVHGAAGRIDACSSYIREKYKNDGHDTQRLLFEGNNDTGILVQLKNSTTTGGGLLRTITGLTSCATLKLTPVGDDLNVEVIDGKWIDKIVIVTVSVFLLCQYIESPAPLIVLPLLVTATIGAFRQKAFLNKVYNEALTWLASNNA